MQRVYIAGVGMTRFGRLDQSLPDLLAAAARAALEDAEVDTVDGVYVAAMNPEEFCGESNIASAVVDDLGLVPVPATRVETASSSGAAAFDEALYAVASGFFDVVLAVAGEKMTSVSTAKASRILSEVIAPEERSYGATMPALAAMITRRYMHEYDMPEAALAQVAVKNHANAIGHPYAHFPNKRITPEEAMASRIVSDPLRVFDCAPISDGAAAVVLSRHPARVLLKGLGQGSEHVAVTRRESLTWFESTRRAAETAYRMAGLSPAKISFAELHDAFTCFEIIGSEDVGFFPPGEGWKALMDGVTARDGRIPINPSGGLKARGHPVGASGLAQVVEAAWQLRGEAGNRQIPREPQYALTQSIGGLATNNIVIILEAVP